MFKRRAAGYTIVETMLFLLVSAAILASAIALVQSQQSKTQFSQSVRDLNSKLQNYINDVNSGFYNGSNSYSCAQVSGEPRLSSSNQGVGTSQDCIFLGKAFSFSLNQSAFTIITVLGNRLVGVGANAVPATDFLSTKPE